MLNAEIVAVNQGLTEKRSSSLSLPPCCVAVYSRKRFSHEALLSSDPAGLPPRLVSQKTNGSTISGLHVAPCST